VKLTLQIITGRKWGSNWGRNGSEKTRKNSLFTKKQCLAPRSEVEGDGKGSREAMHFRRTMAMAAACASASAFAPSGLPSSLSARTRPASVCTMVYTCASALCIWP
jgi:hypothetical protein